MTGLHVADGPPSFDVIMPTYQQQESGVVVCDRWRFREVDWAAVPKQFGPSHWLPPNPRVKWRSTQ